MNASMLVRLLFAALCAAPARAICREPHPLLPTYWSADEPKLAVVGIYFGPPASHRGWQRRRLAARVGSVDGRTVYNVQGIFMSTDLRPWCALDDAACDFAAAAPYTRDRTYVHELIHWFGFAAHSSMTDCADPDADGLGAHAGAGRLRRGLLARRVARLRRMHRARGQGLYGTCDRYCALGGACVSARIDTRAAVSKTPNSYPTPQTPLTRARFAADVAAIWLARVPLRIPQCRNQP
ncbi:hypothetical protein JL721_11642 [Aureococcus anophagefferens]|nr:hypothetical protein JL721_11642 [Aureococcus anophagefferens]